jgi:hypothetical protein
MILIFIIKLEFHLGYYPIGYGVLALFFKNTYPFILVKSINIYILAPSNNKCYFIFIGLLKKSESLLNN